MGEIKKGSRVMIMGFLCEVIGTGSCEDEGCGKPTVDIIDPEGNTDTMHQDECDGCD